MYWINIKKPCIMNFHFFKKNQESQNPVMIKNIYIILNTCTIYFTSNIQKRHRTYTHVVQGADVDILWSYVSVVEETRVPGRNH